jgi:hypothetical protein
MKLGEYQFVVELKSPTLSPQLLRTLEAEGDLYKAWSKKMIHFIYDVIERIIMFDSEGNASQCQFFIKTFGYSIVQNIQQTFGRGKLNCLPPLSFVSSDGKFLDHQIADGFI